MSGDSSLFSEPTPSSVEIKTKKPRFKHWAQFILAIILTAGEFFLLYIMFFVGIPAPNKEVAYLLIGSYSAEWARSVGYFITTTFGSTEKTIAIQKAEPVDPHS